MPIRKSRFLVGLFVTVGVLLGVAAVVWLGASKYFEGGDLYVTYFDESIQGLQMDSRVKYRGVDVGKVQRISVASDERLVEVVVKVDMAGEVERNTVAQLRAAGITGIVFVELDVRNPSDAILLPPASVKSPYPVIPSQTSQTKQMISSADRIMDRIEQVDLKGISDQIKQTFRSMEALLSEKRVRGIIANLDSTTTALDRSLRRIDRFLAEGKVESLVEETRQGIGEARQGIAETRQGIAETRQGIAETSRLVTDLREEVATLKTGELVDRANALLEGLDQQTRVMSADLEETTEDVRQAADSLRLLLNRLRENPSDLIFSRPRNDDPHRGEVK